MSDSYEKVKGGRLSFKRGDLATRSKPIDKKSKKKKKKKKKQKQETPIEPSITEGGGGEDVYTIDPMKKMKYDELFPVECKKFGYDPKAKAASVELALDDRVKKKADRYCK